MDDENISGIEPNHLSAALSYLAVLVLIPLFFMDNNDPFVKFHARQGVVILLGFILAVAGGTVFPVAGNILFLLLALASIAGLIQALQGKWWPIPVISTIAGHKRK